MERESSSQRRNEKGRIDPQSSWIPAIGGARASGAPVLWTAAFPELLIGR